MNSYGGPERRGYVRYDCRYQISFRPSGPDESFDYSQTRNVSKAGILLTVSDSFETGAVLEMIMRIPYSPAVLNLLGKVIWRKKVPNAVVFELGVCFLEDQLILNKFIAERLSHAG